MLHHLPSSPIISHHLTSSHIISHHLTSSHIIAYQVTSWVLLGALDAALITVGLTLTLRCFILHAPFALLLTYIGLFAVGAFALSLLLSTCFSNGKLAAVVAPILFFASVLPKYVFFGTNRYERTAAKMLASLLLPSAFAFGADIIADYEYAERAVTLRPSGGADDTYTFATCLSMMALDAALYLCLFLYCERALPSKFGAREHPCFCLLPQRWRTASSTGPRAVTRPRADAAGADSADGGESGEGGDGFGAFEPLLEAVRERPCIEVVDLVKRYGGPGGKQVLAVDGLNLRMASEHITCLLGHNGAGKTTTLSVLTGLYPPTSGDCFVFGHSITRARRAVYHLLGICPQHDVLWGELTVLEHLRLYAALKRMRPADVAAAALAVAEDVGLREKQHTRARALSGGMKRKLSVGCALIGGSKAVLLDEPSSGMDPASRRSMWELLQRHKRGRALVLTTHYMDEADLLADRIAVMSLGRLRCCGSSLFLKSRYGRGYTLTLVKVRAVANKGALSSTDSSLASAVCEAGALVEELKGFVPTLELLSEAGDELSFRLPLEASPQVKSFCFLLIRFEIPSETCPSELPVAPRGVAAVWRAAAPS